MGEYVFQFHALVHPTKAGIARRETEKFCEIEKQIQGFSVVVVHLLFTFR